MVLRGMLKKHRCFFPGYGVCEKDGWPRICRIQQCHVSAFQNRVGVFCIYLPPFSTSMSEKCVMGLVHYLLHYWCFFYIDFCSFFVSGSSQKKKQATEILPSDTTWKRRRSVSEHLELCLKSQTSKIHFCFLF